jgi:hypothetical protein
MSSWKQEANIAKGIMKDFCHDIDEKDEDFILNFAVQTLGRLKAIAMLMCCDPEWNRLIEQGVKFEMNQRGK